MICCSECGGDCATEVALVETMPEQFRASHRAAGNSGTYPHNGAVRRHVCFGCAEALIEDEEEGDWTAILGRASLDEHGLALRAEAVASYVSTFPSDGGDGACDVAVCVAEHEGVAWSVHTRDDAGGSDEGPGILFAARTEAVDAAEALADKMGEGNAGEDAEDYLRRLEDEAATAAKTDDAGSYAIVWESAGEPGRVISTHPTYADACAAMAPMDREFRERNPGPLLCGFEIRTFDDDTGRWISVDDDGVPFGED
jgi:hypothetical protein